MKHDRERVALFEALRAASLGWDLALPIFGGVLLGHAMDNWLNTNYVFTIGLLLLGVFSGYYNLSRSFKRIERRQKQLKAMAKGKKPRETNANDSAD